MITLDLKTHADKLFSPIFYEIQKPKTRYVVIRGGAGAGKSYSVQQMLLIKLMAQSKGDILVIRKYSADHRESTYKLFKQLIGSWHINGFFKFNESPDNRKITYLLNGNSFVFRGMDDPDKIKSITNIQHVFIEEANQLEQADFDQLVLRARGFENSQYFLLLNPVSENHWIKKQLCDKGGAYNEDTTELLFTYKDNPFLSEHDRKAIENTRLVSENWHRIYALGEWGVDNTANKFAWAFDSKKHLQPTTYDKGKITWATFDFNVNPLTCTIAQVYEDENRIDCIETIRLENSDIWKMCDIIKVKYPDAMWYVTGDATGVNRQAISKDNLNYYQVIRGELGLMTRQIKVPLQNPPIQENQLLVNYVLQNWTVNIDPDKCQPLINDLLYCEMGADKKILKDRSTNERYADFLDNFRYLVNVVAYDEFRSKTKM